MPDRRLTRSSDPLVALSHCFESARKRAGFAALVLADECGLAIAGAGAAAACDELAARAALEPSRPANDTVPCRLDVVARRFEIRRLRIDGIEVLLCAEGGTSDWDVSLGDAALGCQRILSARKKAPRAL